MRLRIITTPTETRVVLSNPAGVEVSLIARDTGQERDPIAFLDCELPELESFSIVGQISHVGSYDPDAADRAALAPLKAKARSLQADHDARTRAAALREAAELVAPSAHRCKCSSCSELREKANLLRAKADEIAPAAAPIKEPTP